MTPDEFRVAGHRLIDWIVDYRKNIPNLPVKAQVSPDDVRSDFSSLPPDKLESIDRLLKTLEQTIVPGITQLQHPMNFGWFPCNASLASVLGDIASSGLGTLGISWESCPALTELEEVVCDWMRQLTGLSDQWHGTITDTASSACLTALLAAREKASAYSQKQGGLQAQKSPLVVYSTQEAHSSVQKSALLAGFGQNNLRYITIDAHSRAMKSSALVAAIEKDIDSGKQPAAIVASVGTTGVTAIDPVAQIVEIAEKFDIWVHVDAAMAGSAMLLPECRWMWQGCEKADSISWNPHKWMGTILDCSLFYVRDTAHLTRVMATNPSYLRSQADGQVTQYRDWGIPLGRRFRALKLWFHLNLDGVEAIRARLRHDLENTRWLADQVERTPNWCVLAPVNLQTVCIRHQPPGFEGRALDNYTLSWVKRINDSGKAYLTTSKLNERWMVRISIGAESTTRLNVQSLWLLIQQATQQIIAA